MAAPLLLRALPLLRLRLARRTYHVSLINGPTARRPLCTSAADSTREDGDKSSSLAQISQSANIKEPPHLPKWNDPDFRRWKEKESEILEDPDFRRWKEKESEILEDIEPIICLTKEILHSDRYMDGARLTPKDQKAVIDKLLAHHPHSDDKIGCGLDSIMVDRHPQFSHSRCLFVVRSDGGWIDFSYQKCLRAYIRDKYPSHAERFIKERFKRGSG